MTLCLCFGYVMSSPFLNMAHIWADLANVLANVDSSSMRASGSPLRRSSLRFMTVLIHMFEVSLIQWTTWDNHGFTFFWTINLKSMISISRPLLVRLNHHSLSDPNSIKPPRWSPQFDWTWHGRCPGSPRTHGGWGIERRGLPNLSENKQMGNVRCKNQVDS